MVEGEGLREEGGWLKERDSERRGVGRRRRVVEVTLYPMNVYLQHSCPVAYPSSLLHTQHTAASQGIRLLCMEEGEVMHVCLYECMVVVRLCSPGLSLSDFFLKS